MNGRSCQHCSFHPSGGCHRFFRCLRLPVQILDLIFRINAEVISHAIGTRLPDLAALLGEQRCDMHRPPNQVQLPTQAWCRVMP